MTKSTSMTTDETVAYMGALARHDQRYHRRPTPEEIRVLVIEAKAIAAGVPDLRRLELAERFNRIAGPDDIYAIMRTIRADLADGGPV